MYANQKSRQRRRGAIDRSGSARQRGRPLSCSLPLTGRAGEGCILAGQVLLLRLASGISSSGEAPETARGRGVGPGSVLVGSRICENSGSGGESSEFSQTRLRRAAGQPTPKSLWPALVGSLPQFPLVRQPPCAFDRSPSGDGRKASAGSRTHCQPAPAGRHEVAGPEYPRCTPWHGLPGRARTLTRSVSEEVGW